jgi:hypothetical protein
MCNVFEAAGEQPDTAEARLWGTVIIAMGTFHVFGADGMETVGSELTLTTVGGVGVGGRCQAPRLERAREGVR